MNKINQTEAMRVLVAIAEEGGFSAAARKLRLQQSAVSRVVGALEDSLGVALLTRTTRKLSFTESGLRYLSESRRILSEIDELNQDVRRTRDVPQGNLKISLPTAFGRWVVVPRLARFCERYPDVRLEVHLEDRLVDLVAEAYDVVIRVGESGDSRVTSRKLALIKRGVFVARKLRSKIGPIESPTDLARYPLVAFDDRVDPASTWTFTQGRSRQRIRFEHVNAINQLDGVYQLACDGLGVAQLPLFMGHDSRAGGRLVRVLADWELAGDVSNVDRVYALFTGGQKMGAKLRVFLDYIVEELSRLKE